MDDDEDTSSVAFSDDTSYASVRIQWLISELPFASVSKQVVVRSLSYEVYSHANFGSLTSE